MRKIVVIMTLLFVIGIFIACGPKGKAYENLTMDEKEVQEASRGKEMMGAVLSSENGCDPNKVFKYAEVFTDTDYTEFTYHQIVNDSLLGYDEKNYTTRWGKDEECEKFFELESISVDGTYCLI